MSDFFFIIALLINILLPVVIFAVVIWAVVKAFRKNASKKSRNAVISPSGAVKRTARHSRYNVSEQYNPITNTAGYPTACEASYNPERAKDQLETLLKAGHISSEEYRQRIADLKKYEHC